jgi:hypothetical protein
VEIINSAVGLSHFAVVKEFVLGLPVGVPFSPPLAKTNNKSNNERHHNDAND